MDIKSNSCYATGSDLIVLSGVRVPWLLRRHGSVYTGCPVLTKGQAYPSIAFM
jgi:hypothetical protein